VCRRCDAGVGDRRQHRVLQPGERRRFFTANDSPADRPAAAVVVLSYNFWRRAFGADPQAVGETILISGTPAMVIGVTPPEYKGCYVDGGYGFSVPLTFLTGRCVG
jgi:hypothetical protein